MMDARVEALRKDHPRFHEFLSRFKGQFSQEQVWPSVILLKADAPKSYYSAESVAGFRDLCALSVAPYARADRLLYSRASPLVFTNIFAFYPWMLDKNYGAMVCVNPAMLATHLLEEFQGQAFPEQSHSSLMENALDKPLLQQLLERWLSRFSDAEADWKDIALFRSLNMANQAAQIPALTAASIYDVGRSVALWVSAHEILAHPGKGRKADFLLVAEQLARAPWADPEFKTTSYQVRFKGVDRAMSFPEWLYNHVYQLRNDFLHGNPIDPNKMKIGGGDHSVIDFAACLYRMALASAVKLSFVDREPEKQDNSYMGL